MLKKISFILLLVAAVYTAKAQTGTPQKPIVADVGAASVVAWEVAASTFNFNYASHNSQKENPSNPPLETFP